MDVMEMPESSGDDVGDIPSEKADSLASECVSFKQVKLPRGDSRVAVLDAGTLKGRMLIFCPEKVENANLTFSVEFDRALSSSCQAAHLLSTQSLRKDKIVFGKTGGAAISEGWQHIRIEVVQGRDDSGSLCRDVKMWGDGVLTEHRYLYRKETFFVCGIANGSAMIDNVVIRELVPEE